MKKILITGGAGFIGYHLAKRLASQGSDITIVDNFFRGKRDTDLEALLQEPNIHLVESDLSSADAWRNIGSGYEGVYHLVGINGTKLFYEIPHEVLRIGVASTMHVLDLFRNVNGVQNAKILYTSSNEAYASALEAYGSLPLPTPENVPLVIADTYNPRWSYGGQKLIGELFFIHYAKAYDFRMVIVRPHNFYGPRSGYGHVIPGTLEKIQAKTDPFPLPGFDETRSFCYIDDAVEAMQVVMESRTTDNGTYHIGNPHEITMEKLVNEVFAAAHWQPSVIEKKESPPGSVKRRLPDVSKIKKDTGWEAKTSLTEGLQKTVDWYLKNPKKD